MANSRQRETSGGAPRRRKRRRRIHWGRMILSILIVVVVIAGVIFLISRCGRDTYSSESGFEKYANEYFDSIGGSQDVGEKVESINYGEIKSVALQYPEMDQKVANQKISDAVKNAQDSFATKYNARADKGEGKFALLMGYESYKTDEEVSSVILRAIQKEEVEGSMEISGGNAFAFTFITKTGMPLTAIQVFESDFRTKLSALADEKLKDDYSEQLTKKYKDYISDSNDNFNNFAVKDGSISFYFNPGTVADESAGIVELEFSNKELKGIRKEEISLRALDPTKPMIAMTFDDGPGVKTTDRILNVMEKYGVVATFFEVGQSVDGIEGADKMLKRELKLGCEVGHHTYSHINMLASSKAEIKKESDKAAKAIKKATGQNPTVMRPPYGNCDDSIAKVVNLPCINWSIDTLDWQSHDADAICQIIKSEIGDGKVILMHSIYDDTCKAVEKITPWLIEQGYQFATVSELITYKYNEEPKNGKFYGYNYFYLDSSE